MRDTARAVGLAAGLVGWSVIVPRLAHKWNPLPQAVFGAVLAPLVRAPMGLRPPALWQGLRWGGAAAVPVVLAVAWGTRIPPVRAGMAARELPAPAARWLLLRIPLGTVWSEEVAYRAALGSAAARAFGDTRGSVFTAAVFGLSHIPDARAAGESVPLAVFVTGVAGWAFAWLYTRSGSLAAPMLAHLAVNEAGALAALAVSRRNSGVIIAGGRRESRRDR
ncbi:CPBP family intramembrane metalloprotease [Mycolicibacterium sp. BiH015]|uniref:Rv0804 family intramembrane glutamic endopeptidase n=1 Tax=Mycolicibacterium sp. BiH015 TaxID=3018808 RepID=UPI0022E5AB8E|nr:CPBP family intramembrane glutamic endopeptidase [Mycolicibacterium sp. BiH015]MDA2889515.1 CPBP family intramembrane metalloprotease [Mycolicibacterium sp. BiH015]